MGKGDQASLCSPELFSTSRHKSTEPSRTVHDAGIIRHAAPDEESSMSLSSIVEDSGSDEEENREPVTWDGPTDSSNPKNWSLRKKWATTIILSCFAFISHLSSSMSAPALDSIGRDLHVPSGVQLQLVLSIFVLAYSFGPFVLSPYSEIWGRVRIIQIGNLVFIFFNTLCGFARTNVELTVFRFITGFGGSATLGMGGAVISDCWQPEERGRGMSIYQLASVLGPAVGPIAGGFIVENVTWRWTFWSITFLNLLIQIVRAFLLKETYAPRILLTKARKIRQETKNDNFRTQSELDGRTLWTTLRISLTRPWRLLATQPIIQALALYQAYNFGMLYLFISSFPSLWENRYGMSTGVASLNYISLALGSLIGAQICGPFTDAIYSKLKKRYGYTDNAPGLPEFRIPLMIPAAFTIPCGIFLYGWSAEAKLHFLLPNIGAALFSCGSMVSYQCTQTYLVDAYIRYAASASAASAFLRSLAAFSFPLFAPYLFGDIGYGWGASVLGLVAIVLGIPAPFVFWKYGQRLRRKSLFASGA